jgi:hypothetical protein
MNCQSYKFYDIFIVGMCLKIRVMGIVFSLFLTACGLDTVFSPTGTYRLTAKVGQYTLDECSIVEADTPIQPYFIESVDDDPDIQGLTLFLQSLDGEIISKKLTYTTDPSKATTTVESADENFDNGTDKTQTGPSAGSTVTGSEVSTGFTVDSGGKSEKNDSPSTTGSVNTGFDGSTAEETIEYDDAYRFRERKSIAEPSVRYNEDVIYVPKLSENLPSLFLPEDLEAGQYLLVFQVFGVEGLLYRIDKPIIYIAKSEFTLDDIYTYLPSFFDGSHIVPPETPIMLETNLAAGSELSPYLVWYSGKKLIHEGYAADGAARFIWKAPAQTGFHVLKVEAFPFKPLSSVVHTPIGRIRELSLPVSTKTESRAVNIIPAALETGFSEKGLSVVRWYQFFANLEDSRGSVNNNHPLVAVDHTPEWLPQGSIFGVAIGPDNRFLIPGPLFTPPLQSDIEGRLLFRFAPLAEGTLFNGSFKLENSSETLNMNLSYVYETLILNYSVGNVFDEKTALTTGRIENLITAIVSFEVKQGFLQLSLGVNTPAEFLPGEEIPLPGSLSGEGTFRIGASLAGSSSAGLPDVFGTAVQSSAETVQDIPLSPGNTIGTATVKDASSISAAETTDSNTGTIKTTVTEPQKVSPIAVLDEVIFMLTPGTSVDDKTQNIVKLIFPQAENTEEVEPPQGDLTTEPEIQKQPERPASSGRSRQQTVVEQKATQSQPAADRPRKSSSTQTPAPVRTPPATQIPPSADDIPVSRRYTPAVSIPPDEGRKDRNGSGKEVTGQPETGDIEKNTETNLIRQETENDTTIPAEIPGGISTESTEDLKTDGKLTGSNSVSS